MKRSLAFKRLFWFDWRLHGIAMLLPLIMFVALESYVLSNPMLYGIQVIQTTFIPWIAWTVILHFQPIFDEGAYDTLVPYYRKWLVMDILRFLLLYFVGYLVLTGTLLFNGVDIPTVVFLHHTELILLFLFFGMTLILWTKRFEYALSLLLMYTLLEVVTKGQFMPWPHVFQFETNYFDPLYHVKVQFIGILVILFSFMSIAKISKRN